LAAIDEKDGEHSTLKSGLFKRIHENMTTFITNFEQCQQVLHQVCPECIYGQSPLEGVPPALREVRFL
jgi:hypothetical protein